MLVQTLVTSCVLLCLQTKSLCPWCTHFLEQFETFVFSYYPCWGAILKWPPIRPFKTKVTSNQIISDQNMLWSKDRVCSKCAPNCHWSNLSRRKWLLIRPKSDHCPDDCATMAQTKPRSSSRRLCAENHFWSDYCALNSHSWSDYSALEITSNQTQLRKKYSVGLCYERISLILL